MKYLLIGGSRDGEEHEVKDINLARELHFAPRNTERVGDPLVTTMKIEIERYHRVTLQDYSGQNHIIFQAADDELGPIARLIKGYKAGVGEQKRQ